MVPIYREDFEDGELLLGWPTWDSTGKKWGQMSVKYRYPGKDGRPSRGAPEVSMSALVGMVKLAVKHGALSGQATADLRKIL
jgi:hypothetical protein